MFRPVLLWSMLAYLSAAHAREAEPFAQARAAFQRAYELVDASSDPLDQSQAADSEELRTYPLYPYLQAARIRRALSTGVLENASLDQRAQMFTAQYEADPVGRALRRVWLASLAERAQWAMFLEQYRENIADDSLRCQSFAARIELSRTANLAPQILRQWLMPRSLPDCERAFEWLRVQNALPPELIEQRVRRALEENNPSFARQIAARLTAERAAPLLSWAALLEDPKREIDALIAAPKTPLAPDALLAGWSRLARTNRDAAMLRYDVFTRSRRLTGEAASPYALAVALALAWDRRPEALEYFARVHAKDLDDYALEWRTRAALWAGEWKLAADSIASMSAEQRKQPRWRYWTARAAERAGDAKLAEQIYQSVLLDDNFYSLMAAARLKQSVVPHPEKLVRDPVVLREIGELPELARARELFRCQLPHLAESEWRQGLERAPPDVRRQLVHLAMQWRWYDQAITTATQLRVFNDYELLYPSPFEREVRKAAKLSGLEPVLIYSVMRQESLYRMDAVSAAGARGLLQMMPETARRTARSWSRPTPASDELFDADINVPLGAAHLRELIDRFNGQIVVALAGYNAGTRAAARWLPARPLDPDVWIENIPYNETRNYVQRILWHNVVFGWLRTGDPQRADAWLARIAPLSGATVLGQR
ncbi:MAG TPA: transglycosylase SLT domain-containing protein [Steroidobacter sp.]|nr:transglycosylase SLT domain-containing protein [Steroidobacter sp.]